MRTARTEGIVEAVRTYGLNEDEAAHIGGMVEEIDEAIVHIRREYDDAVEKAWDNLARYKFSNFGYWASRVVFLGQLLKKCGAEQPANPFRALVHVARSRR